MITKLPLFNSSHLSTTALYEELFPLFSVALMFWLATERQEEEEEEDEEETEEEEEGEDLYLFHRGQKCTPSSNSLLQVFFFCSQGDLQRHSRPGIGTTLISVVSSINM